MSTRHDLRKKAATILLPAMVWPAAAHAGRPMVTDDARLNAAESCQIESWMQRYSESKEAWAVFTCNPTGGIDIAIGGALLKNNGESATSETVIEAKTLFRELKPNDWAWGIAGGIGTHYESDPPRPTPRELGSAYVYLPVSVSLADDKVILHANAGVFRNRTDEEESTMWALGGEVAISSRWTGTVEAFGDDRSRPYWQVGASYVVVPDKFQLDATVGRRFSDHDDARWVSIGIVLTLDKLF